MILQARPGASFDEAADEYLAAARRVLESGWYVLGREVERFESNFAAWCGVDYAVACANGTDAIELCLRSLGQGEGKAVFTVAHTAVATVAAIERAGCVPWLVDIERRRLTLDPARLEEALEQALAAGLEPFAVVPVHIYGQPADMDPILALAAARGLHVIEDCAQAHGATYKGRMAGGMGHMAAFSMYPTKNLGAFGDAGMVVTKDACLAERAAQLRQYGWKERYISAERGINSRMDPLQAAFLDIKLARLDADNQRRRRIAACYDEGFAQSAARGGIAVCRPAADSEHVYHQYVLRVKNRAAFQAFCLERGVGTAVHYPVPVHRQPAYAGGLTCRVPEGDLPETCLAALEVVSLPMYPQLSGSELERVVAVIREWSESQS